jgi:hypothetical protein
MKPTRPPCDRSHLPELREDRDIFFSHLVTNKQDPTKDRAIFYDEDAVVQMADRPRVDPLILQRMATRATRKIMSGAHPAFPPDDPYRAYLVIKEGTVPALHAGDIVPAYVGFPLVWFCTMRPEINRKKIEAALKLLLPPFAYAGETAGCVTTYAANPQDGKAGGGLDRVIRVARARVDKPMTERQALALANVMAALLVQHGYPIKPKGFSTYYDAEVFCNVDYSSDGELSLGCLSGRFIFV